MSFVFVCGHISWLGNQLRQGGNWRRTSLLVSPSDCFLDLLLSICPTNLQIVRRQYCLIDSLLSFWRWNTWEYRLGFKRILQELNLLLVHQQIWNPPQLFWIKLIDFLLAWTRDRRLGVEVTTEGSRVIFEYSWGSTLAPGVSAGLDAVGLLKVKRVTRRAPGWLLKQPADLCTLHNWAH